MSSPSGKRGRRVSPRFHLVAFVFGVPKSRELGDSGSPEFPTPVCGKLLRRPSSSYRRLLDRVAFEFCQTSTTELLCKMQCRVYIYILLKTIHRRDRRPHLVIFVGWSASIVGGWVSSRFHLFVLDVNQADEEAD